MLLTDKEVFSRCPSEADKTMLVHIIHTARRSYLYGEFLLCQRVVCVCICELNAPHRVLCLLEIVSK